MVAAGLVLGDRLVGVVAESNVMVKAERRSFFMGKVGFIGSA